MTLSLFDRPGPFADLFDIPDPDVDPDGLRYYQAETKEKVFRSWAMGNKRVLIVHATGLGKTTVAVAVLKRFLKEFGGCALWLAHRDELLTQARERLEQMTSELVDVEKAEWVAGHRARWVVGSMATFHQRRLERFARDRFSIIFIDEAHHATNATYTRILEWFSAAKVLGATATPDRSDEIALGKVFDDVADVMEIDQGIDQGFLVPVRGKFVEVKSLDLDKIKKSKGDLQEGELENAMLQHVDLIVQKTLEEEPHRQGIAFFPGVRSAELAAARFNHVRPGSAAFVYAKTPDLERRGIVRDFRAGRYFYLCNCDIFGEGADFPLVSLFINGSPTLSRAKYAQRAGRITRVLPGLIEHVMGREGAAERRRLISLSTKPDAMILDFVGNSTKHSLMGPEDILGGEYSEVEVKVAKKKRKEGDDRDVRTLLEEARRELERLAKSAKTAVKADVREFDPFNVLGIKLTEEQRMSSRFGAKPASELQLAALRKIGVAEEELNGLSKSGASKIFDHLAVRRKLGFCTYKQLAHLRKFGISETKISFERANAAITYIASRGWNNQRVDLGQLQGIIGHKKEVS